MGKIKVLVADSQPLFAESLGGVLAQNRSFSVIQEFPSSGREAVEAVFRFGPDVAMIDYWISGMEGPAVVNAIKREAPQVKVLLLSWFYGVKDIKRALQAGAVGFLPKNLRVHQVAAAIQDAQAGVPLVFPEEVAKMVDRLELSDKAAAEFWRRLRELTPRELEILELLAYGLPMKALAERLCISLNTLRTHVHRVLDKTGTRSQMEAVALARRYGVIQG